jgi:hypothetical protein
MQTRFTNLDDLKDTLPKSQQLQDAFKSDPIGTMDKIQLKPLDSDVWIYRIVVLSLGFTIVAIIVGVIVLIAIGKITDDKGVPTILTAIGSAAIGALAGLLAPSPVGAKS